MHITNVLTRRYKVRFGSPGIARYSDRRLVSRSMVNDGGRLMDDGGQRSSVDS
jgi:hypothetical protein